MKNRLLLVALLLVTRVDAGEPPKSTTAEKEGREAQPAQDRIAPLEARVAKLERELAGLRRALAAAGASSPDGSTAQEERQRAEEDRHRYERLSDAAKKKFRDAVREQIKDPSFLTLSDKRRAGILRGLTERIEAEDKATPSKKGDRPGE